MTKTSVKLNIILLIEKATIPQVPGQKATKLVPVLAISALMTDTNKKLNLKTPEKFGL